MQTELRGTTSTIIISPDEPTVMIGERINPTGRKAFTAELQAGDLSRVAKDAESQYAAGARLIDVNVGTTGVDEVAILPRAIQIVQETVDVPVSIDSANPKALEAGLKAAKGRPLVNSVNGEADKLRDILPIVAAHDAVVIALCLPDGAGIPMDPQVRFETAERILEAAARHGITPDRILFDPLSTTISTDPNAAVVTLTTARMLREKLDANMTIGASNVSFGMPEREVINVVYMSHLISAGVNAPICNPNKIALVVRAADLLLGRDETSMGYIKMYRALEKLKAQVV